MKKIKIALIAGVLSALISSCCTHPDGEYTLHILSTNDIHGTWFDSTYVGNGVHNSLYGAKYCIDSIRTSAGAENVILIDAGDILQGDNVAYFYNYVDTLSPHLYPRMAKYMGYDAVTGGNHDVETGHAVYDRVAKEIEALGIPYLAGNAIRNDNGERYFRSSTIFKKNGFKIAVLGYNNANISAWLNESLWSGMKFVSLIPLVQEDVDALRAKENPDLVIVSVHSGTGKGDGSVLESQGLDLFYSLCGVDAVLAAHDHRPYVAQNDSIIFLNSGSHNRNVAHGEITLTVKDGKVVSKNGKAGLLPVSPNKVDTAMRELFHADYQKVKAFSTEYIGTLSQDLVAREAFFGMSPYLNLIHTITLKYGQAQISFAAPLNSNGNIKAGDLIYNDLMAIYPYENQIYTAELTGAEIKNYLEYSYSLWIKDFRTDGHVLNIVSGDNPRTGEKRWSFRKPSFNFDSAAGINYSVDITKPYGSRIYISSLADGSAFDLDKTYRVAMTSYRASGGGELIAKGAGLSPEQMEERIVCKYPEFRTLLYDYMKTTGGLNLDDFSDPALLGSWKFTPAAIAEPLFKKDYDLLFGNK